VLVSSGCPAMSRRTRVDVHDLGENALVVGLCQAGA
jgi:hypothetical protein